MRTYSRGIECSLFIFRFFRKTTPGDGVCRVQLDVPYRDTALGRTSTRNIEEFPQILAADGRSRRINIVAFRLLRTQSQNLGRGGAIVIRIITKRPITNAPRRFAFARRTGTMIDDRLFWVNNDAIGIFAIAMTLLLA